MNATDKQRLDKYLWFARVVKTRTLAAKLIKDGHVRLNGTRTDVPAKTVGLGDVLTIALERDVRVLKILLPGERRGPYAEACLLFEDLSEKRPPREETVFNQPAPAPEGRPDRRERRDLMKMKHGG